MVSVIADAIIIHRPGDPLAPDQRRAMADALVNGFLTTRRGWRKVRRLFEDWAALKRMPVVVVVEDGATCTVEADTVNVGRPFSPEAQARIEELAKHAGAVAVEWCRTPEPWGVTVRGVPAHAARRLARALFAVAVAESVEAPAASTASVAAPQP